MATGKIKFFNEEKGFGFIKQDDGGPDVFAHVSQLRSGNVGELAKGAQVSFDVAERNGKIQAQGIEIQNPAAQPSSQSPLVAKAHARLHGNDPHADTLAA